MLLSFYSWRFFSHLVIPVPSSRSCLLEPHCRVLELVCLCASLLIMGGSRKKSKKVAFPTTSSFSGSSINETCKELLKLCKERAKLKLIQGCVFKLKRKAKALHRVVQVKTNSIIKERNRNKVDEEFVKSLMDRADRAEEADGRAALWQDIAEERSALLEVEKSRMKMAEKFLSDLTEKLKGSEAKKEAYHKEVEGLQEELLEAKKSIEKHKDLTDEIIDSVVRHSHETTRCFREAFNRFEESARLAEQSSKMTAFAQRELQEAYCEHAGLMQSQITAAISKMPECSRGVAPEKKLSILSDFF